MADSDHTVRPIVARIRPSSDAFDWVCPDVGKSMPRNRNVLVLETRWANIASSAEVVIWGQIYASFPSRKAGHIVPLCTHTVERQEDHTLWDKLKEWEVMDGCRPSKGPAAASAQLASGACALRKHPKAMVTALCCATSSAAPTTAPTWPAQARAAPNRQPPPPPRIGNNVNKAFGMDFPQHRRDPDEPLLQFSASHARERGWQPQAAGCGCRGRLMHKRGTTQPSTCRPSLRQFERRILRNAAHGIDRRIVAHGVAATQVAATHVVAQPVGSPDRSTRNLYGVAPAAARCTAEVAAQSLPLGVAVPPLRGADRLSQAIRRAAVRAGGLRGARRVLPVATNSTTRLHPMWAPWPPSSLVSSRESVRVRGSTNLPSMAPCAGWRGVWSNAPFSSRAGLP